MTKIGTGISKNFEKIKEIGAIFIILRVLLQFYVIKDF